MDSTPAFNKKFTKVLIVGQLKTKLQKPVERSPVNLDTQATGCAKLDLIQDNAVPSSMCPWYSKQQLRRIDRIQGRRYKYGHRNITRLQRSINTLTRTFTKQTDNVGMMT